MPLRPEHEIMAIKLRSAVVGIFALGGYMLGYQAEKVFEPEPQAIEFTDAAHTVPEDDPHLPLGLMLTMAGTALGTAAAVRFVEYPDRQEYNTPFTTRPRRPFM